MRKLRNFAIFLLSFCVTLTLCACLFYKFMLTSVDKNNKKEVLFEIESGDTSRDIAKKLYDEKLIKNDKVFLVYLKLNGIKDIKAGYFNLNKSMDVKEIADELRKNTNINPNSVYILFKEGLNMRKIASIISESTDNSYDSVLEVLDNDEYIDSLIEKYWFLTNDIKNNNIYYALEGYLYPDTYRFESKDVKVEEIFEKMLDKEDEVLSKYKEQIDDESYSIHEVLTLASIAELEASDYEDKRNITGVFNNRLDKNMNLGSDVTTFYAFKIDDEDEKSKLENYNTSNPYNTRSLDMKGKLPIGPICNPSEQSIKAVLNPIDTNYLFFVADKNGKVYYSKTDKEHEQIKKKLKNEGLWQ